jgi:hypothetical protein
MNNVAVEANNEPTNRSSSFMSKMYYSFALVKNIRRSEIKCKKQTLEIQNYVLSVNVGEEIAP